MTGFTTDFLVRRVTVRSVVLPLLVRLLPPWCPREVDKVPSKDLLRFIVKANIE